MVDPILRIWLPIQCGRLDPYRFVAWIKIDVLDGCCLSGLFVGKGDLLKVWWRYQIAIGPISMETQL